MVVWIRWHGCVRVVGGCYGVVGGCGCECVVSVLWCGCGYAGVVVLVWLCGVMV